MDQFNLDSSGALKSILDMVLEASAWQGVIIKELARKKADETGTNLTEVVNQFEKEKAVFKKQIFDNLFTENGPDLIGNDL